MQKEKEEWKKLFPTKRTADTKPLVGRSKKEIQLDDALANSAHIDSFDGEKDSEKRTRIDWFDSPFIHDILHSYSIHKFGYLMVRDLRNQFPRRPTESSGKFDFLSRSTVDSWFDKDHHLLRQYANRLANGRSAGLRGRLSFFSQYPNLEKELVDRLLALRLNGVKFAFSFALWSKFFSCPC